MRARATKGEGGGSRGERLGRASEGRAFFVSSCSQLNGPGVGTPFEVTSSLRRASLLFAGRLSLILSFCSFTLPVFGAPSATNQTTVIVVVGAPGDAEFGSNFVHQADLWTKACSQAGCRQLTIGLEEEGLTNDYDRLKLVLSEEPKDGLGQLWLVLIGHGTFDGKEARFNLRGPDFSATELALWLQPFHRPMAVLDTAAASAPFLNKLSGTNRVVITATRSGSEQNFTRFGQFFAEAITSPEAWLPSMRCWTTMEMDWARRPIGSAVYAPPGERGKTRRWMASLRVNSN